MSGGNSKEFYYHEGTTPKSNMLLKMHPDVTRVVIKFNRVHHHVDYSPFKDNSLILNTDISVMDKIDNYGMILK